MRVRVPMRDALTASEALSRHLRRTASTLRCVRKCTQVPPPPSASRLAHSADTGKLALVKHLCRANDTCPTVGSAYSGPAEYACGWASARSAHGAPVEVLPQKQHHALPTQPRPDGMQRLKQHGGAVCARLPPFATLGSPPRRAAKV